MVSFCCLHKLKLICAHFRCLTFCIYIYIYVCVCNVCVCGVKSVNTKRLFPRCVNNFCYEKLIELNELVTHLLSVAHTLDRHTHTHTHDHRAQDSSRSESEPELSHNCDDTRPPYDDEDDEKSHKMSLVFHLISHFPFPISFSSLRHLLLCVFYALLRLLITCIFY